jgi:hypothetical protein
MSFRVSRKFQPSFRGEKHSDNMLQFKMLEFRTLGTDGHT